MTNNWSVEQTEDIQEVDKLKKPASKVDFDKDKENERHIPGQEKGSSNEHERQPDHDKEAAP
jgi:hypothetical protein